MIVIDIFLSYKEEDNQYVNGLRGLLQNPNNKYRHRGKIAYKNYRNKGKFVIKKYLKDEIRKCDALICIVGNDTHTSEWVLYELQVAKSFGKKIVAVRIKGTNGGRPRVLDAWKIPDTNWNATNINNELSKLK
ncbi:MAG: TIR domain-containing protein [Promethearchaeota archaeon]|nr:MAG: TIR domain-containing protein [Candidatus Lokiarchaeota archaeon]